MRFRLLLSTTLLAVAVLALPAVAWAGPLLSGGQPATPGKAVSGETGLLLVRPAAGSVLARGHRGHGPLLVRVPKGRSSSDYAAELVRSGQAAYAEPDYARQVTAYTATPADPDTIASGSWLILMDDRYVSLDNAKSWWQHGSGGIDVMRTWPALTPDGASVAYHARATGQQAKVGVIDTGYYMDTPDRGDIVAGKDCLESVNLASGTRVTDGDVTPVPYDTPLSDPMVSSHGTMVASEIAAAPDNGTGGTGTGYDVQVRVYKVQGIWTDGNPDAGYPAGCAVMLDSAIVDAIYTATDDGCRVINMSLGGGGYSQSMQEAIDYAHAHGVVVVAATGNDGTSSVLFPAAANHVIGVGAYSLGTGTGFAPVRASFSSWGVGTDLLAPGVCIWGPTVPGWDADGKGTMTLPGYTWWNGTSMASPLVAATAANLLRLVPDLSPDDVEAAIESSARDMGVAGYDYETGWGQLDAGAATDRLLADYPALPAPEVSGITDGGNVYPGPLHLSWLPAAGYGIAYRMDCDWTASTVTTATAIDFADVPLGERTVTVTLLSPRNWVTDPARTYRFTVGLPDGVYAPVLALASAQKTVAWGSSAALSGTLSDTRGTPLAGQAVLIQKSTDGGATWSGAATATAGADGSWKLAWAPGRNVLVRASYAGDAAHIPGTSATVALAQQPYVGTPVTPSHMHHGRTATVYSYFKPRQGSGSYPLRLCFYRHERQRNGTYKWVLRKTVKPKAANYSSYTKCSAGVSLPYAGSWKAVAYYDGTASWAARTSGTRYVRVY